MNEIITSAITASISLLIGWLAGYAYAYFSGLGAVRKGMQLLLRITLDSLYTHFAMKAPTADNQRIAMTIADFAEVNSMAAYRSNQLHIKYNELKTEVNAAQTVEEVEAITWDD